MGEITPSSKEFKEANANFEKLTSAILSDALQIDDKSIEKRLVVKLHEACGFDQASVQCIVIARPGFMIWYCPCKCLVSYDMQQL